MPRKARKQADSGTYHIMLRGNNKQNVFIDDEDKQTIIEAMLNKREQGGFKTYAFCVMDNHLHLVIREDGKTVSQVVKGICISYAYYFNHKYEKIGHLFQDRFRSEPIKDNNHLLTVIRYIHNNPVKAFIAANAKEYKWSSYSIYTNSVSGNNFPFYNRLMNNDIEDILLLFSATPCEAIRNFESFSDNVSEEVFMDFDITDGVIDKMRKERIINEYLRLHGLCNGRIDARSDVAGRLIYELKSVEGISLRQIADLLRLNRGTVQRATKSVSKKNRPCLTHSKSN